MDSGYKAVQYKVPKNHKANMEDDFYGYDTGETRYCIVSTETGEF